MLARFATLTGLAYGPKEEMESLVNYPVNMIEQVYMYVNEYMKQVYVVFRGTDSKEDMLTNMDLFRETLSPKHQVLVHSGFKKEFDSVKDRISTYLSDIPEIREYEIHFLGHSSGMACAMLASLYFNQYYEKIHCLGFGGPRVGNKDFAKLYASRTDLLNNTLHVINHGDPVPKVPMSFLYQHVPCKTLILKKNTRTVLKKEKDCHWFWRPYNFIKSVSLFNFLKVHEISTYIKRLEEINL